jgi:hypothetical protein
MFCNGFSSVFSFFAIVLDTCFKCFICLRTYLVNVSSECFKNTLGVAHVAMAPMADGQQHAAGLRLLPRAVRLALSSPLLSLPSPPSHHGSSSLARTQRGAYGPTCGRAA